MHKIAVFICLLIFSILVSFFFISKKLYTTWTKTVMINNQKILLEVADTDASRAKGLSGRSNLSKDSGMLFIFSSSGYHYFWMKDMEFPLDFIWISGNKIVDISKNVPVPKNYDISLTDTFTARQPFDKVLEMPAGSIETLSIKTGDIINL